MIRFDILTWRIFSLLRYFNATEYKCRFGEVLSFSQILDGALCMAFKDQLEFVSPLQVTHLPPVWGLSLPLVSRASIGGGGWTRPPLFSLEDSIGNVPPLFQ